MTDKSNMLLVFSGQWTLQQRVGSSKGLGVFFVTRPWYATLKAQ
jgi:hypothetical protein